MAEKHDIKREAVYHKITQCEVHREIYRELKKIGYADDHPITLKLMQAYDMGKKLNNKLRQYRYDYDDQWWEDNKLAGGSISDPDADTKTEEITGNPV